MALQARAAPRDARQELLALRAHTNRDNHPRDPVLTGRCPQEGLMVEDARGSIGGLPALQAPGRRHAMAEKERPGFRAVARSPQDRQRASHSYLSYRYAATGSAVVEVDVSGGPCC